MPPICSLKKNDPVIVETENGLVLGTVTTEVRQVPASSLPANLKDIIRQATGEDLKIREDNDRLEEDARRYCMERITARNLPMKLTGVECLFDRSKVIFYFTAENRVDFRSWSRTWCRSSRPGSS